MGIKLGNEVPTYMLGTDVVDKIYIGNDEIYNTDYFCMENQTSSTVSFSLVREGVPHTYIGDLNLEYSYSNKITWNSAVWSNNKVTFTLSSYSKLYLRGNNPQGFSYNGGNYYHFEIASPYYIKLSGNIMSLVDKSCQLKEIPNNFCFYSLFESCSGLGSIGSLNLSATILKQYCYEYMFRYCTSISAICGLPATTLADSCYYEMFRGCTSLINLTGYSLPATTLATSCYGSMFRGCTSLSTPINISNATTLGTNCFNNMYSGCTYLSSLPVINATNYPASSCSYMFDGCSNLTINALETTTYKYRFRMPASTSKSGTAGSAAFTNMFRNVDKVGTPTIPDSPSVNSSYWTNKQLIGTIK